VSLLLAPLVPSPPHHPLTDEITHAGVPGVILAVEPYQRILRLLDAGETVELDETAYMRLRARGDRRPASEPQIRRVFALARVAGLVAPDGRADREQVLALVHRVAGTHDVDSLNREQVQDVYDELERIAERARPAARAALP